MLGIPRKEEKGLHFIIDHHNTETNKKVAEEMFNEE
jgi:hypothetical protein